MTRDLEHEVLAPKRMMPHGEATAAGIRGELSPARKRLVEFMNSRESIGLTEAQIAERLDMPAGTVSTVLSILREMGLIPGVNKR